MPRSETGRFRSAVAAWCLLAGLASFAPARSARAQDRFPASRAAIRAALCPAHGDCHIDFVLAAGRGGGASLAVVRVRSGRSVCGDERRYRDVLVANGRGGVRRLRELARGECPSLEWHRSSWAYENGELVFTFGGMGAPPGAGADMRPMTVHIRPWPLAIIGAFLGSERTAAPEMPERGPIFRLSME